MRFAELPGFWTPILPAHLVGRRPRAVTLAGEPLVLFRNADGVHALDDRCPHRGVALSLGRVDEAGCLECPFHGWRFGGDGACVEVPLNPEAKRERLGAGAVPTRELGGLVWIFTGAQAIGEPDVPEGLLRPGVTRRFVMETWDTHWTRAMENMLDVPHLPWVHRGTIGRGMRRAKRPDSRMSLSLTPSPTGFSLEFALDDQPPGRLDWLRPNGMALHILDGDKRFVRPHIWCVPTAADQTLMLIASAQRMGVLDVLAPIGDWFNRKILTEDRAVVESSQPQRVPPPAEELSVASDAPTLHFRAWYRKQVQPAAEAGRRATQAGALDG